MADYFRLIVDFAALSAVFSEKLVELVAFYFFPSAYTGFFYLNYGMVTTLDDVPAPTRLKDVVVLPEMVTSVSLANKSLFFTATVFSYCKLVDYTTVEVVIEEFLVGAAFGMVFVNFSRLLFGFINALDFY